MRPSLFLSLPLALAVPGALIAAAPESPQSVHSVAAPPAVAPARMAPTGSKTLSRASFGRTRSLAEREQRKARELFDRGVASSSFRTARKHFRAALKHDARAKRALDRLIQDCTGDAACTASVAPIAKAVEAHAVRVHEHIVGLYRDQAAKYVRRGLRESTSLGTSLGLFRTALRRQTDARKLLEDLYARGRGNPDEVGVVHPAVAGVRDEIVRTHLHIAHLYTARESYNKARKWVNLGLAIDPTHRGALDARARIELAISHSN